MFSSNIQCECIFRHFGGIWGYFGRFWKFSHELPRFSRQNHRGGCLILVPVSLCFLPFRREYFEKKNETSLNVYHRTDFLINPVNENYFHKMYGMVYSIFESWNLTAQCCGAVNCNMHGIDWNIGVGSKIWVGTRLMCNCYYALRKYIRLNSRDLHYG